MNRLDEVYSCPYIDFCGETRFEQRRELMNHLILHSDSSLPCIYCGATFSSYASVKSHYTRQHKLSTYLDVLLDESEPLLNEEEEFSVEDDLNEFYQKCYLKYTAVHLIPAYVVESILSSMI